MGAPWAKAKAARRDIRLENPVYLPLRAAKRVPVRSADRRRAFVEHSPVGQDASLNLELAHLDSATPLTLCPDRD
jgi:hypothetical protein